MEKDRPIQLPGVSNHERLMISDQLSGTNQEMTKNMALAIAEQLLKALTSRENVIYALVEYLINKDEGNVAGRVLGGMALKACQMRSAHLQILDNNPMGLSESSLKAIKERVAAADMGMAFEDIHDLLGPLPEF
jgi:CDP-glycerol glycerophosphotransferase (TagB/SpsB family)